MPVDANDSLDSGIAALRCSSSNSFCRCDGRRGGAGRFPKSVSLRADVDSGREGVRRALSVLTSMVRMVVTSIEFERSRATAVNTDVRTRKVNLD